MIKHLHILLALAIPAIATPQVVLISEDFDAYNNGQMLVATLGLPWATWSGSMAEDVPLSNEQAASGTISARFNSTSANGGPGDIILRLGNRTSGSYVLSWNMYIPQGFGGYFNLQHQEVVSTGSWAVDVTFRANGGIQYTSNVTAMLVQYPQDQWFNVTIGIDLDTYQAGMAINGNPAAMWQTNVQANGAAGPNQLGGVNFYPYAGGDQTRYYIDDVTFTDMTTVGVGEVDAPVVNLHPNPTEGPITVTATGAAPYTTLAIHDVTGREVLAPRQFLMPGQEARAEIDLSGMPAGLYFVRIAGHDMESVHRVIKQ